MMALESDPALLLQGSLDLEAHTALSFPWELSGGAQGILGYCRTIHGDQVTVDSIWSGPLFDLSGWRDVSARSFAGRPVRVRRAALAIAAVELCDASGRSVAPSFIPAWSFDLRMGGVRIASASGMQALRLAADARYMSLPDEILPRVTDALRGTMSCCATGTTRLRVYAGDAERLSAARTASVRIHMVMRAAVLAAGQTL